MMDMYWFLILLMCVTVSFSDTEPQTLIKFRDSLSNNALLNDWNVSKDVCSWTGVVCDTGEFIGLQLEGFGLSGVIDVEALTKLPSLRTVSFMNNDFHGPIPNLRKLSLLRGIYLSNNRFSGEISPDFFSEMQSIRRVFLSNNAFVGKIPKSLADLSKLLEIQLQNNEFEGEIPKFEQKGLFANLANNKLVGPIPPVLSKQNSSYFSGNKNLCGKPLKRCKSSRRWLKMKE